MMTVDEFFGVPLKPATDGPHGFEIKTKLPGIKWRTIGVDHGRDDMTAATYNCAKCGRLHSFTERPEQLPHVFMCDCGNKITVQDPILEALPKAAPAGKFAMVRKAILDQLGEPLAETDIDDAARAAIEAVGATDIEQARTGLEAAIRAAKLALFVIRKQGEMPNSSWEAGFEKDLKTAETALAALPRP